MPGWTPIPGETPINDLSFLKVKGISTRRELNVHEAENIRKAALLFLAEGPTRKSAPFTYDWMLHVHKIMFGDVWEWAGQVRRQNLSIGVEYYMIGQELGGLALDIDAWEIQKDLLIEQSARIHHRAVQIHPFENGNGRWSRMLANIWLRRHGSPLIAWPEPAVGSSESPIRQEYLDAIRQADLGNRLPLEALHQRYMEQGS
ncbi:MAG: Fic family protein [Pirellulaceae bacterium]